MSKRALVLAILDGWGIGRHDSSNPIYLAKPANIELIKRTYPAGTLQASGIAVGLPWGSSGDSEVGHLTLGAGRVLYQHYPRISLAIKDGRFFKNEDLLRAFSRTKSSGARVHFIGLIGEGNIHSSFEHLEALIGLAGREKFADFFLHLFPDGRDSAPEGAARLIEKLPKDRVASISGRYFALDRDLHWERTKRVFDVLTGTAKTGGVKDVRTLLETFYKAEITDEFIEPTLLRADGAIRDGDSIIFFNFREDGMRQLAEMFARPDAGVQHTIPKDLYIVAFTAYEKNLPFPAAFPAERVARPLGKVLADAGYVQLRIAETEKYAHVTYFFNGLQEAPFKNEYRVLIPSRNVARQDEAPEMMANAVTARVLAALNEGIYDFILVNYANPDVIAHTGNLDAAIVAVKTVDEQIGHLMRAVREAGGILVITSDHGNVERMIDPKSGIRQTAHEENPVPLYVVTKGYEREKSDYAVEEIEKDKTGVLSDVAPTVLHLMGIPKPPEMTGVNLLQSLR